MKIQNTVRIFTFSLLLTSLLSACVGAQFNETAPLQRDIEEQYTISAKLFDQAQSDFQEKTYVFKNLKVSGPLRDHYQAMTKALQDLGPIRERIETEKNAFLLLTKGKAQISSKDKAWTQEQNTIQSFNADMALFNKKLADYSRESGIFGNVVSENKMMVIAKVPDIKTRMGDNLEKSKKTLKVLDADIAAAKKLAKANGVPFDDVSEQTISAERNAFADNLKELETIYNTIKTKWGNKKVLANTDPEWDQFQKLVATSEIKSKDLHDIGARLPLELEAVKKSK